jgi:hypothetical protein
MLSVFGPSDSNLFVELLQLGSEDKRSLPPVATQDEHIFDSFCVSQARMLPLHALQRMQGLRPSTLSGIPLQGTAGSTEHQAAPTGSSNNDKPEQDNFLTWEAPARCDSPDIPYSASPPQLPAGLCQTTDRHLAEASLHVLLGCSEIIPRMLSGTLRTETIRPAALQAIAQPICEAGLLRAFLNAFLHQHGIQALDKRVDPEQHALVFAVQAFLELHSSMLWEIVGNVRARRERERAENVQGGFKAEPSFPTLLEVLQHTRSLRRQIDTLARLCWCYVPCGAYQGGQLRWQAEPFPLGCALLEHLHAGPAHLNACSRQAESLMIS